MTVISRPQTEIDIPKTSLVNHVSPGLQIDWPSFFPGSFEVPLTSSGATTLNVANYRRVSVLVGSTQATQANLRMGMLSGTTLGVSMPFPLDGKIHTFDVVGPEIGLDLLCTGKFAAEKVQLWLYLSS
jgi:hypothetical protein